MNLSIRDVCPDDIARLAELTTELGYPTSAVEMEQRINCLSAHSDYRTLIALRGSIIAGYAGIVCIRYWEKNGCYVKIQALVVSSTERRTGVGVFLLNEAEKWAKEKKADMLALTCGNKKEREAAHMFYPESGFVHNASGYVKMLRG